MKRILLVLLLTGCVSAPVRSGYVDGMADSGIFETKLTDSAETKEVKVAAAKVVDAAQEEIKALNAQIVKLKNEIAGLQKHIKRADIILYWLSGCLVTVLLIAGGAVFFAIRKKTRR